MKEHRPRSRLERELYVSTLYAKRTLNALKHLRNVESSDSRKQDRFTHYLMTVAVVKLYETYLEHLLKLASNVYLDASIFDIKKLKTNRHTLVHNFIESNDSITLSYIEKTLHSQTDYLEDLKDRKDRRSSHHHHKRRTKYGKHSNSN